MKGDEIIRPCDWHSNETVTLKNHVTKYKHMREWMFEFLSKSESRDNKIVRVNPILIPKYLNLLLFRTGVGVRCDVDILNQSPVRSPFIEKSIVVYISSAVRSCDAYFERTGSEMSCDIMNK